MFLEVLLLAFVALVLGSIYWYATIPKNLPPGPVNLPFIGHPVTRYGNKLYLKLHEWSGKFGPMVSFYVRNQLVIVLNDYELVKEAFLKQPETYSGKPVTYIGERLHFDHGE